MQKHHNIDTIDKHLALGNIYEKEDGFLYCSKCHGKVSQPFFLKDTFLFASCQDCSGIVKENAENKAWFSNHNSKEAKKNCFSDKRSYDNTFENDNSSNATVSTVIKENYLKNFATYKAEGKGLLLWGATGTGKTFFADAILHKLIEMGYTAKKYSLPKQFKGFVTNKYTDNILSELKKYQVVCIDDLGAERESPAMIEFVYSVIDELYSNKIIIIFTTNLNYEEMKKSAFGDGIGRIYSRVIGSCIPLEVNKNNQRVNEIKGIIPLWNETNAALKAQGLL